MSGGYWDYRDSYLAHEIFGYDMDVDYGEDGWNQSQKARSRNPLDDREVSEMCWDLFCLMHSFDYYMSGDTSKKDYEVDLKHFKDKWSNRTAQDKVAAYKNDLRIYCDELLKELD